MRNKKTLQELTIKDNFMFGAVMVQEENARRFLEMVLGFPISRVEIAREKCFIYHPEYKGIRLDIFAQDENNTCYNVEMQAVSKQALGKRTRYYHSQIDMDLLSAGEDYMELPDTYVIFICDFDPFAGRKYRYTFKSLCIEDSNAELSDGQTSIFLSTKGLNVDEEPLELIKFLNFVEADLSECMKDFEDDFVENIQKSMIQIKSSRSMEERFMSLELMLMDERREGRIEGHREGKIESILDLLSEHGPLPQELKKRISTETDKDVLKKWLKLASHCESIDAFVAAM